MRGMSGMALLACLFAWLTVSANPAFAQGRPPVGEELLLGRVGIRTDLPSLLDYLTPRPALDRDDKQIEGLIRQLGSDDFKDREQAVKDLMACGRKALPALERAKDSEDAEIVVAARSCIRDIEGRTNAEFLAAEVRLLARHPPTESVKGLIVALAHPSAAARKWASDALYRMVGLGGFADVLLAIRDEQPAMRLAALEVVSRKFKDWPEVVAPVLIEAIRDEDAAVRRKAAWLLRTVRAEEGVVQALIEALDDKDDEAPRNEYCVAAVAADSLMGFRQRARPALPGLMELSRNGSARNRRIAILTLGHLARSEKAFVADVVPYLVGLLEGKDHPIENRVGAAAALSVIGPDAKAAVPALREALKEPDTEAPQGGGTLHGTVLAALGKFGSEAADAVPDLIAIMQDRTHDAWMRKQAADALGDIGPAAIASVPALRAALRELPPHHQIRDAASQSLSKVRQ